jgi:undecaprenyl-diphosphatase
MSVLEVIVLAVVQGVTELLPVSSSAHVVVAEKLMGLDPSAPEMTLLLVMLHTGTMFAVLWYFWSAWRRILFQGTEVLKRFVLTVVIATAITGVVGEAIVKLIETVWFHNVPSVEVEDLFSHLELVAPALAVAGVLIITAGWVEKRRSACGVSRVRDIDSKRAALIGVVQGFCLPFRGFSRSGATISTAMLTGATKVNAEEFSFALAIVLTPPVVLRELLRLMKAEHVSGSASLAALMMPSILGAFCAFVAGVLALKWLTRWLEGGRWHLFGVYCLVAAGAVALLHYRGY